MKKGENIKDILKKVRKNIKPSKGPLTSIDPKKLAKASEDVKIAKEIEETSDDSLKKENQEEQKKQED